MTAQLRHNTLPICKTCRYKKNLLNCKMQKIKAIKASTSFPTHGLLSLVSRFYVQCSLWFPARLRNKSVLLKPVVIRYNFHMNIFTKSTNTHSGLEIKESPWQQRQDGQIAHRLQKIIHTLPQLHKPTHPHTQTTPA